MCIRSSNLLLCFHTFGLNSRIRFQILFFKYSIVIGLFGWTFDFLWRNKLPLHYSRDFGGGMIRSSFLFYLIRKINWSTLPNNELRLRWQSLRSFLQKRMVYNTTGMDGIPHCNFCQIKQCFFECIKIFIALHSQFSLLACSNNVQ